MKYLPTDVQLLVFDDAPHVATTLGHTRSAKYQYRAIANFSPWALSRAQHAGMDLQDDTSYDSDGSGSRDSNRVCLSFPPDNDIANDSVIKRMGHIGKIGEPLLPFVDHMIRQRVDRNGNLFPLKPIFEIRKLNVPRSDIGQPKEKALGGWREYREMLAKKVLKETNKDNERLKTRLSYARMLTRI